jgi:NADH:ubiquinone oxidoreductase subunit E
MTTGGTIVLRQHTIVICMGSSCFSRGNQENLQEIKTFLKDNDLEDQVLLKGSRCEGECLKGPNITVDGRLFNGVKRENILSILEETLLGGSKP